ncbi:substrate-binding domain-containing protein [Neptuniibacter sp.]|uniref:substrate-binding domain-containing protein n=1 Tax=Neptuniibacter sp. TaxID=1962643 RepID=UPI002612697C|nr:substrate-binding domain-containing protein [Neptuniibacter sp.]MCP4595158.1 substrate-binding domain-containing protein [Neptuniibacter sp.]
MLKFFFRLQILLLTVSFSAFAQEADQYVRISDYLLEKPEQKTIMQQFSRIVREQAIPYSGPQDNKAKVAIIYPGDQASDYWRRSVIALEKRMTELQVPFETRIFFSRPSVDLSLQSQQLNEAIAWQPDYLIYTLDALRHQAMIERILLRGKPKLILQNITTPLRHWLHQRPFLYTGFDHETGTKLLAQEMLKLKPEAKYGMLYFTPGYVSVMRGDTFVTAASEQSSLTQLGSYYTKGDRNMAYKATQAALRDNSDLDMLFSCSTDISLGAIDALKEYGKLDQVLLNGWGGGQAEIDALIKGELDLTVMRMNDDSSVAIAEAIKLDLQGQNHKVPHIYSGDIVLIDKSLDQNELNELKERAFRYSGQGLK